MLFASQCQHETKMSNVKLSLPVAIMINSKLLFGGLLSDSGGSGGSVDKTGNGYAASFHSVAGQLAFLRGPTNQILLERSWVKGSIYV